MAAGINVIASDLPVEIGDALLATGQSHVITEDTSIRIGSGVHLRITPGGGNTLAAARQQVQITQRKLQQQLDEIGLGSPADAENAFTNREKLKADIQAKAAHLTGLGAEKIEEEYESARNAQSAAELDVQNRVLLVGEYDPPASLADARCQFAECRQRLADAESRELSREVDSRSCHGEPSCGH